MSGATFTVRTIGSEQADRELAALVAAGTDLTEFNQAFGLVLESNTIDRFDRETGPDGVKWTPSARATAEGGKTLTDTARLKGSITHDADGNEIRVGTNTVYGGVHQFGFNGTQKVGPHKRKISQAFGRTLKSPVEVAVPGFSRQMKMPVRAYLGLGAEDRSDGAALFTDFFADKAPGLFDGGQP